MCYFGLTSEGNDVSDEDKFGAENSLEKWRGDNGAAFQMTGFKVLTCDTRL